MLDVAPYVVLNVVRGALRALFDVVDHPRFFDERVSFFDASFKTFLLDREQSGSFHVPIEQLDAFFLQILSNTPTTSRTVLVTILHAAIAWPFHSRTTDMIASVLDVAPKVVRDVVHMPIMRALLDSDPPSFHFRLFHRSLRTFLLDRSRSGEFWVASDQPDALFLQILSRQPPSSRKVLMAVLHATIAWPSHSCTIDIIAFVLDVTPNVLRDVVCVPGTRALLNVDPQSSAICLFDTSLKTFLLDHSRSGDFFVPSNQPDALFLQILSRQPSTSRKILMGVLHIITAWPLQLTIVDILDVDRKALWNVVCGPGMRALLIVDLKTSGLRLFDPSFRTFLLDQSRSGDFSVPSDQPDSLFLDILSRQLPSTSRKLLTGTLHTIIAWGHHSLTIEMIASVLDVAPTVLRDVVCAPGMRILLNVDPKTSCIRLFDSSFTTFLLDHSRSGEFCFSSDQPDTLFLQILSRQPPSSRKALTSILRVVVARSPELCTIEKIASVLGAKPNTVRNVVCGPLGVLFDVQEDTESVSLHNNNFWWTQNARRNSTSGHPNDSRRSVQHYATTKEQSK